MIDKQQDGRDVPVPVLLRCCRCSRTAVTHGVVLSRVTGFRRARRSGCASVRSLGNTRDACLSDLGHHRDHSHVAALGRDDLAVAVVAPDSDRLTGEVDVAPAQRDELAAAQPGHGGGGVIAASCSKAAWRISESISSREYRS